MKIYENISLSLSNTLHDNTPSKRSSARVESKGKTNYYVAGK